MNTKVLFQLFSAQSLRSFEFNQTQCSIWYKFKGITLTFSW